MLVFLVSCISVKRKPTVYKDEKPVDEIYAASVLGKYTFSWAERMLTFAGKNKKLELTDLPILPGWLRAQNLESDYLSGKQYRKLWAQIFWKFRWSFVKQTALTTCIGVVQFGPQFALLHVLRLLERRQEGVGVATEAYLWVAGLGLSMLVVTVIESWLYWLVWSEIGIPIKNLLSTLIFSKATRRKNVQDAPKAKTKKVAVLDGADAQAAVLEGADAEAAIVAIGETSPNTDDPATTIKEKEKTDGKEDEEEDTQKTRQSTINLVAVRSASSVLVLGSNRLVIG